MKIIQWSTITAILTATLVLSSFSIANAESLNTSNLNAPSFNKLFKFSKLICGESICSDTHITTIKYEKTMKEEQVKTQKKLATEDKAVQFMKIYYRIG